MNHPVEVFLGLACLLTVAFTQTYRSKRRDHDDSLVAYAQVVMWVCCWAAREVLDGVFQNDPLSFSVGFSVVMDLTLAMYCAKLHDSKPALWKRFAIYLIALQIILHGAKGLSEGYGLAGKDVRNRYRLALNITFIAQLLCVISPGGIYAARRLFARSPVRPGVLGFLSRGSGK